MGWSEVFIEDLGEDLGSWTYINYNLTRKIVCPTLISTHKNINIEHT